MSTFRANPCKTQRSDERVRAGHLAYGEATAAEAHIAGHADRRELERLERLPKVGRKWR